MPRLIDVDEIKLPQGFFEKVDNVPKFYKWLDEQPTVDAVEVVRCKDCRFCHAGYCEMADDIIPFGLIYHEWENFYCAWGERKEDA